jgi:hypothetical protein
MGWDFEVHIVVLALASEVFSVFLSGHFSESTGDKPVCLDVPQEILKAVLDFIYHGRTKVEHIYATQMLKFAHMYTMEALQLQITNQLCGCLDPEVAIDVMVECTALGLEVLLDAVQNELQELPESFGELIIILVKTQSHKKKEASTQHGDLVGICWRVAARHGVPPWLRRDEVPPHYHRLRCLALVR